MISYVTIAYHMYYHTIIKEIIVYIRKPSPRTKYCCQSPQHLQIFYPNSTAFCCCQQSLFSTNIEAYQDSSTISPLL